MIPLYFSLSFFLLPSLPPFLTLSSPLVFSSPLLLHNRCGCNASLLERHYEAALETESETDRESENAFYYCALTHTHVRKRSHTGQMNRRK